MGIKKGLGKSWRAWGQWNNINELLDLGGWKVSLGSSVAAMLTVSPMSLVGLSAIRDWDPIWLIIAALAIGALVSIIVFVVVLLFTVWRRAAARSPDKAADDPIDVATAEEANPHPPSADRPAETAPRATGTTNQSFPHGLHISSIWIQRNYLPERSVIHINLNGFNGTGEDIFLKSIHGQITVKTERGKAVGELAIPSFVGVRNTRIDAYGEFCVTLEQHVSKRFAGELMGNDPLDRNLLFDGLNIIVQAINDPLKVARLPLWEGAALAKSGKEIGADRLMFLRSSQSAEIIELRSIVARLVDAASTFVEFKGRIQECIDRIEGSNHPIWLDFDARNARNGFLHQGRVARAMREDHGSTFGDMAVRSEVLSALVESQVVLDQFLYNYRGQ